MRAVFLRPARIELLEAVAYYEGESPGLSDRLLAEVRHGLDFIRSHPSASPLISHDVRRKLLHRFPYSLLYSVEKDFLLIVAFMHHKRRPGYWADRLD